MAMLSHMGKLKEAIWETKFRKALDNSLCAMATPTCWGNEKRLFYRGFLPRGPTTSRFSQGISQPWAENNYRDSGVTV